MAQVAIKSGFPRELVQQAANPQPRGRGPMQGGKGKGAGAKGPAAGGKGPAEAQAAAAGGEQGPTEGKAAEAAGTEGASDAEAGGAPGGAVGVVASRLLRSSCVSKAVEEARKDFLAKFGKGGSEGLNRAGWRPAGGKRAAGRHIVGELHAEYPAAIAATVPRSAAQDLACESQI